MRRYSTLLALASLLGIVALCFSWASHITGSTVHGDAAHTLRMGLNLARTGTISLDTAAPYEPTMYREPVPALLNAAAIAVTDAILGPAEAQAYFSGPRAHWLKYQNIAWMLLLSLGTFAASRFLTGSTVFGLIGLGLVNIDVPLLASGPAQLGIDTLQTDMPAAAMLVIGSLLMAIGFTRSRPLLIAAAGLSLGLLALIKAAFLYIFAGIVAVVLILGMVSFRRQGSARNLSYATLLVASFAVVVAPWMYRNYVQCGAFSIAERGGIVLYTRAVKDLMTAEEYMGTFYIWANSAVQPLVGRLLGFSPADLNRHGRLQHLNRYPTSDFYQDDLAAELAGRPEQVISYYRKARAERVRLTLQAQESGTTEDVDRILQQRAMRIIVDHPFKHLALIVPLLWRAALVVFPILLLALAYAARHRRLDIGLFVLPAFGMVMFYATLSHFIPRYSVPALPIAIASALLLLQVGSRWLRKRLPAFRPALPSR